MFIEQGGQKAYKKEYEEKRKKEKNAVKGESLAHSFLLWFKKNTLIKLAIIFAIIIILTVVFVLIAFRTPEVVVIKEEPKVNIEIAGLPKSEIVENSKWLTENDRLSSMKAEDLLIGSFYKENKVKAYYKLKGITLPINIKNDTANFYDVSRRIDLAEYLDEFNENGFVMIDNPFNNTNDFYGIYKIFNQNNIPYFVTDDFLVYYYQNSIKNIFKDIEGSLFYRDFWNINMQLFKDADTRYKTRYRKVGLTNDPVLEGYRLAAAYFATSLELLKPKANQISKSTGYIEDDNKFTLAEAEDFQFTIPDYLAHDIGAEIELIRKSSSSSEAVKSPALLYRRGYEYFKIPREYSYNSKLNNFYLANKWANSLFPLYYQDSACPDCLLDENDWIINQVTAHLIARDFAENQILKNKWAQIYKVISFFSGLRDELTQLHYSDAFVEMFPERTIEEVFDVHNETRGTDLLALQTAIANNIFNEMNGGYDRNSIEERRYVGMRMLQDPYWQDEYVADRLINSNVGNHNNFTKINDIVTACNDTRNVFSKCRGIGYDTIGLIFDEEIENEYLTKNIDYAGYENELNNIKEKFVNFDKADWHSTLFWSSLKTSEILLNNRKVSQLPYTQSSEWTNVGLNSAFGTMLLSKAPVDLWSDSFREANTLTSLENVSKYGYVTPNLPLINELISNAEMLFKSFYTLGVIKENNVEFDDLLTNLDSVRNVVLKELNNQDFNYEDRDFINSFVNKYTISMNSDKTVKMEYKNEVNNNSSESMYFRLNDKNIKLLLVVQEHQGENIIFAGPAFDYKESITR